LRFQIDRGVCAFPDLSVADPRRISFFSSPENGTENHSLSSGALVATMRLTVSFQGSEVSIFAVDGWN
jgi:hypothetical protein